MRVETPENVAIEYPLAGPGSRFAAFLADATIVVLLIVGVPLVIGLAITGLELGGFFDSGLMIGLYAMYAVLVSWGYFLLFEALWDGQTPGKRLLSIRVVMEGGYPVTTKAAAVRNLLRILDVQPGVTCLFGGLLMLVNSRGKRLGDIGAGTVVVREMPIEFPEIQAVDTAAAPPRLSEAAYSALESFVDRAGALEATTRIRLGRGIWQKMPEEVRAENHEDTVFDATPLIEKLYADESARRHSARLSLRAGSAAAVALLRSKRDRWERFRSEVRSIRLRGLRSLDGDEVSGFAARFRDVSADLARARTYGASAGTLFALERLVGTAHNLFYRPASKSLARAWRWISADFPRLVRARWKPIAVATLLLYGPAFGSYTLLRIHPELERELAGGEIIARAEAAAAGAGDYRDTWGDVWLGSGFLSTYVIANNVQVSFIMFVGGALACLGSAFSLLFNGLHLGSAMAVFANRGVLDNIGLFIAPHGVIELTAICIAGGAGLWMGSAILLPGRSPRGVAFSERAREGVSLVGGVAVMLLVAGLIEGIISPSRLPAATKLFAAGLAAISMVIYLALAGRRVTESPAA